MEMKFVEMPARDRDPVVAMRDKMVNRLREQASLLANPDHIRATRRWKGKGDERHEYEQRQKVRPYSKPLPGGLYALAVYCGGTPLEFQPGKPCIAVKSRDELADAIQAVISADSDEVARAFRDDVARCTDMMSPGSGASAGGWGGANAWSRARAEAQQAASERAST
jgi:hypothetical protein